MAKQEIGIRIFIGGRPIEEFTPEELDAKGEEMAKTMGDIFNTHWSLHPEEYLKLPTPLLADQTPA